MKKQTLAINTPYQHPVSTIICWDADTLRRLAHFCHERGIIVVSD